MSDVAIRVEGLGKKYQIGAQTERADTFRDAMAASAKGIARNIGLLAKGQIETSGPTEEFWALRDVDFEIKRGEAVGIIGRNGAGKSTLLKVLSRITEPTVGRITLNGRVASLLEVGTGFHPELTGRENIYLNGAIIGMTRAEIRRKFDEIVDFAGVEKFLDTPVKRYSSGMGVRLGFAVAAHLEPEILIVDEVLAVGDAEFQKKCLGKMNEVAGEGRTVLFVSHNMAAVRSLCTQGIYMSSGEVRAQAAIEEIVTAYSKDSRKENRASILPSDKKTVSIDKIIVNGRSGFSHGIDPTELTIIDILYRVHAPQPGMRIVLTFKRSTGEVAFSTTDQSSRNAAGAESESHIASAEIPENLLNEGIYDVELRIGCPGIEVVIPDTVILELEVQPQKAGGSTYAEVWPGAVAPKITWNVGASPKEEKV